MQKEVDDALVFAEKEDYILTETSTAELSERGHRMARFRDKTDNL